MRNIVPGAREVRRGGGRGWGRRRRHPDRRGRSAGRPEAGQHHPSAPGTSVTAHKRTKKEYGEDRPTDGSATVKDQVTMTTVGARYGSTRKSTVSRARHKRSSTGPRAYPSGPSKILTDPRSLLRRSMARRAAKRRSPCPTEPPQQRRPMVRERHRRLRRPSGAGGPGLLVQPQQRLHLSRRILRQQNGIKCTGSFRPPCTHWLSLLRSCSFGRLGPSFCL